MLWIVERETKFGDFGCEESAKIHSRTRENLWGSHDVSAVSACREII